MYVSLRDLRENTPQQGVNAGVIKRSEIRVARHIYIETKKVGRDILNRTVSFLHKAVHLVLGIPPI